MELLHIDCLGKPLRLRASMAGWQQLSWDTHIVAEQPATGYSEGHFSHAFEIQIAAPSNTPNDNAIPNDATPALPQLARVRLEVDLQWQDFKCNYQLFVNDELVSSGTRNATDMQQSAPQPAPDSIKLKTRGNSFGLFAMLLKLLQSAKFVKVALAGLTLATYSAIFSFQFALALIACLVVHEYGHVHAMKHFGIKTKGFYLIPFFGGMALTDEKINTRWQDVVISIMGPTFGLILSLILWGVYLVTDNIFIANLANFNAFLNLINLIPVLPLDGGHVVKSVSFSASTRIATILLSLGTVLGIFISYQLGLFFLAFVLFIGTLDIVVEWRQRHHSLLLPMNRYGQIVSVVWYVATMAILVGIIWHFAQTGDPLLSSPFAILKN
ncbi:site-2 protease family protein [Undibacterium sp. LX40W]|uniref:Site-2 protease family protein n=1 Tax=Undibacterium nitidum TaxID=2762298 RepID=A0A923HKU7_9BURK|nr:MULTISPECIES: site-2 protease family protein [Undibacterium]MBC3881500.1 site-2 protease family protein [Undibacterium nitidum]MBC3891718.1 site-2 protease family protein [Undibacterium sp. LX40W]